MFLLDLKAIAARLVVVHLNALFEKFFLLFLVDLMFPAVPHVNHVFLTVIVFRLGFGAKNKQTLLVFQVFEVKDG